MNCINMNKKGFSLVELSIVLIIIGLLVGGVTGGSKLIQNAKLNSVMSELQQYQTAYQTFILTYDGKPGDITDAKSYWTSANLANGNGNGEIDGNYKYSSNVESTQPVSTEMANAWLQLSLSGIIPQSTDGSLSAAPSAVVGKNVPTSKFSSGSFYILWDGLGAFSSQGITNFVHLGKIASSDNSVMGGVMIASHMQKIDKKLDDGKGVSGSVRGYNGNGETDCGIIWAASSGAYKLSSDKPHCRLVYKLD